MVICTAMASAILYRPRHLYRSRDGRAGDHRPEAQNIVGEDAGREQVPVALLQISKGLKSIAGESGVGAAESDGEQQSPTRIGEDPLAGPDKEKSEKEAARDIDEERAVRKVRGDELGCPAADEVSGAGANHS